MGFLTCVGWPDDTLPYAMVVEDKAGRSIIWDIIPGKDREGALDYAQEVADATVTALELGQVSILDTNEAIWQVVRLSFYPNDAWDGIEAAADIAEAQRELEGLAY